jgi:hypothetical protein
MRRRAIVVMLDGLRRDMVGPETTPELHRATAVLQASKTWLRRMRWALAVVR